jgi:hypothetical protein
MFAKNHLVHTLGNFFVTLQNMAAVFWSKTQPLSLIIKMKTTTKQTNTAVNIVKKTVFAFKSRPVIAPKGLQKGTFVGAINEAGVKDGKQIDRVVVTVELETADGKGSPFVVTKDYNILPNGRGFKAFLDDYNGWSGKDLTEDDMYSDFNGEADKGKPLTVKIGHRKNGKEWEAVIEAFHPAGFVEEVVA